MTVDTSRPVILIDLSAIFRMVWHATVDEPTSAAFDGTLGGVKRAISLVPEALVAIACDGKGNWRKELSPEYKAHRAKEPDALYGLLDRVKERLRKDGHLLWEFPLFEADDVLASACAQLKAAGHDVTVATNDKDLAQLVGPGVRLLSTKTFDFLDEAGVIAKFGVKPEQIGDWLALVGDASDGIKGAPGIGPKRAAELLNAYGNIKGIYAEAVKPEPAIKGAILKSLLENDAAVGLARQLVTLKGIPDLKIAEIYEAREMQRLTKEPDAMDLDGDLYLADSGEKDAPLPNGAADVPESAQTSKTTVVTSTDPRIEVVGQTAAPIAIRPAETALAPVEYSKQLEPRSFSQVLQLADYLYESRLFGQFANKEAIAAVIMRGREMGLGGATALSVFHVIEGRPAAYAYLIIARAKAHPDCEYLYCVEASPTSATWETKNRRNPGPQRVTFTWDDAVKAKLPKEGAKGPNGWLKNPEDMLVKSAGVKLARREYPDAALGLYSIEELGGE